MDLSKLIPTPLFSKDSYFRMLKNLFPVGPAWNFTIDSLFGKLVSCFSDEMYRYDEHINKLRKESIPGLSEEMLTDWEAVAGLPDKTTPDNPTLLQRQQLVHAKITQAKGEWTEEIEFLPLTPAYYIKYAESFNMIITIAASTGYVFRTTQRQVGYIQRVTRTTSEGIDGARLNGLGIVNTWIVTVVDDPEGNRSILESIFDDIRPAHTLVHFQP